MKTEMVVKHIQKLDGVPGTPNTFCGKNGEKPFNFKWNMDPNLVPEGKTFKVNDKWYTSEEMDDISIKEVTCKECLKKQKIAILRGLII